MLREAAGRGVLSLFFFFLSSLHTETEGKEWDGRCTHGISL